MYKRQVQQGVDEVRAIARYLQLFESLAQGVEFLAQQAMMLATQAPLFPNEPALLSNMAETAAQEPGFTREDLAVEILRRLRKAIGENARPKIVVFASEYHVATQLAAALKHCLLYTSRCV